MTEKSKSQVKGQTMTKESLGVCDNHDEPHPVRGFCLNWRPVEAVSTLDERLARGERGIPKIPDSPDTRHAVASAPMSEQTFATPHGLVTAHVGTTTGASAPAAPPACQHRFLQRHEYYGHVWWQCDEGCDFLFRPEVSASNADLRAILRLETEEVYGHTYKRWSDAAIERILQIVSSAAPKDQTQAIEEAVRVVADTIEALIHVNNVGGKINLNGEARQLLDAILPILRSGK